jgi:regulatory protein
MPFARQRSRIRELSPDPAVAARQAKDLCLRLLTDRARTRQELADVLASEGVPPEVSTEVLDRLEELRLVDDGAYAQAFVRSRQRAGMAKRTVTRELRAKGVGAVEAEAALEDIGPEDERATAVQLARRRAARTAGLETSVRRRRLVGVLARRGYPGDVVSSVVAEVLGEEQELDDPMADPRVAGDPADLDREDW